MFLWPAITYSHHFEFVHVKVKGLRPCFLPVQRPWEVRVFVQSDKVL